MRADGCDQVRAFRKRTYRGRNDLSLHTAPTRVHRRDGAASSIRNEYRHAIRCPHRNGSASLRGCNKGVGLKLPHRRRAPPRDSHNSTMDLFNLEQLLELRVHAGGEQVPCCEGCVAEKVIEARIGKKLAPNAIRTRHSVSEFRGG